MNAVLAIMLIFACLSVGDKIIGNRFGYGEEFDKGLATMGPMCLCLIGIYCLGLTAVENCTDQIAGLAQILPFDPSIIIGSVLASDMGSLPISLGIAENRSIGLFAGIALGATIGQTISFQLPMFLTGIRERKDIRELMNGSVIGIAMILPGVIIAGILYKAPVLSLLVNCIPIAILCLSLIAGFKLAPDKTASIMEVFGNLVMLVCVICFTIVVAGIYIPKLTIVDYSLVKEAAITGAKMAVVVIGSLSFTKFANRHFGGFFRYLAGLLKTNEYAIIGMILSLTTSLAMIPLFSKMDRRGQKINAAFAISGAFIIGGQMGYVSDFLSPKEMIPYFICKIIGGFLAVLVVCLTDKTADEDKLSEEVIKAQTVVMDE